MLDKPEAEKIEKILEDLAMLEAEAAKEIKNASAPDEFKDLRVRYLGKKSPIIQLSRSLGEVPDAGRPRLGQAVNAVKEKIDAMISVAENKITAALLAARLKSEKIDITLPGRESARGRLHPLTLVKREIEDIFIGMGYVIADGPQVESDYFNFEMMNMPKDHPARAMQDSFYFSESTLLRTHTSPVQARTMQAMQPKLPVKIICPGTVYRCDDDATHSPMFHQVEGLLVDKNVTLASLKGTLLLFAQRMFGEEREIRLRPSYFPFTEPSAEVDISCFACGGAGCRLCKGTGWIEILGAGMVHPRVLQMSGYDPHEVSGFAFGMGVERVAMLKYGINDMRLLFDNDIRFLAQF